MNDSWLDRWAANVSAWATIGLMLGGILSCATPVLRTHYELVTTLGSVIGALFAILVLGFAKSTGRRVVSLSDLLAALAVADWLLFTNHVTLGEYALMRRVWILRHVQS